MKKKKMNKTFVICIKFIHYLNKMTLYTQIWSIKTINTDNFHTFSFILGESKLCLKMRKTDICYILIAFVVSD